jgi:radical SAM/Cys-rich protein
MRPSEQFVSLNLAGKPSFIQHLKKHGRYPVKAYPPGILQINVSKKCNLKCLHCHVEAGLDRTETMDKKIFEACLSVIRSCPNFHTVDLTGGAPEMNPDLEWFIGQVAFLNKRLIVRSNLVILLDPAYCNFINTYRNNRVEIVASLPDYQGEKTDKVRGAGVFEKLIKVIHVLNYIGYGKEGSGLILSLAHNPAGAYLPASQGILEGDYKSELKKHYGIEFNNLYSITNMPVGRFLEFLIRSDNYNDYMAELIANFNPESIDKLMCKNTLSVAWDGTLYDCDFNQMLEISLQSRVKTILEYDNQILQNREIAIHNHCYGCTAGSGSSCQGAMVS